MMPGCSQYKYFIAAGSLTYWGLNVVRFLLFAYPAKV